MANRSYLLANSSHFWQSLAGCQLCKMRPPLFACWLLAFASLPLHNAAYPSFDGAEGNVYHWLISIFVPPARTAPPPTPLPAAQITASERECGACRCGLINTLQRHAPGRMWQTYHQYPWMAMLLVAQRFHCLASLINDLYVLTSAHCVDGISTELIRIRLLAHKRRAGQALVVEREVELVQPHSSYEADSYDNDIALIRFKQPVDLSRPSIRPICLPKRHQKVEGEAALATRWGAGEAGRCELHNLQLQEAELLLLSQAECRLFNYSKLQFTNNMLCAEQLQPQRQAAGDAACNANGGGPLHVRYDEQQQPAQYQLVGIALGCNMSWRAAVYNRVGGYLRWIGAHTSGACYCLPQAEGED